MPDWLKEAAGPEYAAAILWTVAALVVLLVVLFIVKLIRSMTFGTFVAGGRNRKTRLAVMDATAVDSHRRLGARPLDLLVPVVAGQRRAARRR